MNENQNKRVRSLLLVFHHCEALTALIYEVLTLLYFNFTLSYLKTL